MSYVLGAGCVCGFEKMLEKYHKNIKKTESRFPYFPSFIVIYLIRIPK